MNITATAAAINLQPTNAIEITYTNNSIVLFLILSQRLFDLITFVPCSHNIRYL